MAGKVHEIAFKIAGKLASSFSATFQQAGKVVSETSQAVNAMNRQAGEVGNIIKMRREVLESAKRFQDARMRSTELGREFAQQQAKTARLAQEHAKAKRETEMLGNAIKQLKNPSVELVRQFENSRIKTSMLETAMRDAEQETRRLGTEFDRARNATNRAEKELVEQRAALQGAERAAGTAGQSIQQLSQRQKDLEKSAQRAAAAQANFNKTVSGIKGNVASMKENGAYASMGGAAMGAGIAAAVNSGMNFEAAMSKVGAISRASEADLAKLSAQAKQLGADTEWSASQAAEGMTYLSMAGFKTEDTLKAMPGMLSLATAGSIDLGRAADIASNILTGFGKDASEMGNVGDILVNTFTSSNTNLEMLGYTMKYAAPIAKSLGVSMEEAAGMAGKLGDAGIQGEMAGTTLRSVMLKLSAPTKAGAKAMEKLGVSTTDASGNMRSVPDILADLNKAMAGMSESARAETTKTIFETEAMSGAMILMEQAGSGALQKYIKSLGKTGTANETARKQADNLSGDMKSLGSKIEAVSISIYESISPTLRSMAQDVTSVISKVNVFATENQGLVKVLTLVAGGISVATAAVLPLTIAVKTAAFYWSGLKVVLGFVKLAFMKTTWAMAANKAAMIASKVQLIAHKAAIIACKVAMLAWKGVVAVCTAAQWLFNAAMAANPVGLVIVAIAALIAIGVLLYKNWDTVVEYANMLWEKLKQFGSWIAGGFVSAFTMMRDKIAEVFGGLMGIVKTPLNAVISIVNKAISAINGISVDIPDWVPGFGGQKFGVSIPQIPMLAEGGVVSKPTLSMIGEGNESEAVMPLSKLEGMMGANGGASISVSFSPTINIGGGGNDAYSAVRRGLDEGAKNLKRELERLLADKRRLSYM